jgi:hypothetical protein
MNGWVSERVCFSRQKIPTHADMWVQGPEWKNHLFPLNSVLSQFSSEDLIP